jgi:CubicO group peptidase (beta-lactamase class C family)
MLSSPVRFASSLEGVTHRAVAAALLLATSIAPLCAQRFSAVDRAVRTGIDTHVYPGAVVVVGRSDTILYARGYGNYTWNSSSRVPDIATTRWDLASLTKIVATTSATAVLVQQHKLDLDAPVSKYLPEFVGGRKSEVTVRMLLNHTSGMPAYVKLWEKAKNVIDARRELFAVPLRRVPGVSAEYSDLNAMLAGLVVERVSGKPLASFVDSAVFSAIGMASTHFRVPPADKVLAVPTGQYRGTPVGGVVNDQNAVALGGVSGHAGVFSTGLDMARFAQAWLRASDGHGDWLNRKTATEFLTRSEHSDTRALGWDTPIAAGGAKISLYGACATRSTFGHTGWTGTELWIDPKEDLFVVLLTNRSYAPRNPKQSFLELKEVRAKVADAVRSLMGKCGS